jgi:hypothetical protein
VFVGMKIYDRLFTPLYATFNWYESQTLHQRALPLGEAMSKAKDDVDEVPPPPPKGDASGGKTTLIVGTPKGL